MLTQKVIFLNLSFGKFNDFCNLAGLLSIWLNDSFLLSAFPSICCFVMGRVNPANV